MEADLSSFLMQLDELLICPLEALKYNPCIKSWLEYPVLFHHLFKVDIS